MPRCEDCEFFEIVGENEKYGYRNEGRCMSPRYAKLGGAHISGDQVIQRIPCRLHTCTYL